MHIWAAAGALVCSLAFACVADVHADDNRNGDVQIHKGHQRDHQGAHVPVYRIKSLCSVNYACVPGGMNSRGEASATVWRVFDDESYGPFFALVWHPATDAVEELGNTLGGSRSGGGPLNKRGQMAGTADLADGVSHAFFWDPNTDQMEDIGSLVEGLESYPNALNDTGQVVGYARSEPTDESGQHILHAFSWDPRTEVMEDLGPGVRVSSAEDVNDKGVVTGGIGVEGGLSSDTARFSAFVWESRTRHMQLLPIQRLNANEAGGQKINDQGQVMGWVQSHDNQYRAVFRWDPRRRMAKYLDINGGQSPVAEDMNEVGQIVGWYFRTLPGDLHAFFWDPDARTFRDLGAFGPSSGASSINNFGWVTGSSEIAGPDHAHAFLWNGGALLDLNALIAPDDPLRPYVTLKSGLVINDEGRILATGTDSRDVVGPRYHAYVLSPANSQRSATP